MSNISRYHFDRVYGDYARFGDLILYQIGDLSCEAEYEVSEHEQWCHEITYVVSGKGVCYCGGQKFELNKGDVHFAKKGEQHNIFSDSLNPIHFLYIGFDVAEKCKGPFREIMDYLLNMESKVVKDRFDISTYFYAALNELLFNRSYTDIIMKNNLENLLVITYREFIKEKNKIFARQNYKDSFIYDIMYYINCNIRSIKRMEDVAEEFGYSYNYIAREFVRVTGKTMKSYVLERKFEIAVNLLLNSDKNVTDIADELSFSSLHTFSRAFRKHFGISPQQYKTQNSTRGK